jgi:hypothetical protein
MSSACSANAHGTEAVDSDRGTATRLLRPCGKGGVTVTRKRVLEPGPLNGPQGVRITITTGVGARLAGFWMVCARP